MWCGWQLGAGETARMTRLRRRGGPTTPARTPRARWRTPALAQDLGCGTRACILSKPTSSCTFADIELTIASKFVMEIVVHQNPTSPNYDRNCAKNGKGEPVHNL